MEDYIEKATDVLNKWKISKNNITSKTKIMNENKTSLEILERNIGENEHLEELKKNLNTIDLQHDIVEFNDLEKSVDWYKKDCLALLRMILDLHSKIQKETVNDNIDTNDIITDPVGIEVAKLLWSNIDNLQLRADPPISGVYKDEFRQHESIGSKPLDFGLPDKHTTGELERQYNKIINAPHKCIIGQT